MQKTKVLIALFVVVALCPLIGNAQELQGTINGTVMDPSGAVIPNAKITVTQNGVNGASRAAVTDPRGSYTITNLPAANYTVTVTAPGFQSYAAQNVVLNVAQTRTVDVSLKTGSVTQTVTVQQNAVSIDTTTSAQAGTISGTQVRELQLNNRNFEQLVTLQPGVVSALPDEVGFGLSNTDQVMVNGARGSANNWTVDGADINDSGSNLTLLNVPSVDAIQEFTLQRSTYDAGYGRSGGGQVLVATRSGTSTFHGTAYEFNRNNIFNANSYFNNQAGLPRAIERYNDFGFTLGGPVYIPKVFNKDRNKIFFFWSEEWRKVSAPVTGSVTPPTSATGPSQVRLRMRLPAASPTTRPPTPVPSIPPATVRMPRCTWRTSTINFPQTPEPALRRCMSSATPSSTTPAKTLCVSMPTSVPSCTSSAVPCRTKLPRTFLKACSLEAIIPGSRPRR
jgi:hypothetical protein